MMSPFRYHPSHVLDFPRFMMSDPFFSSQGGAIEAQMPEMRETDNAYQIQVSCPGINPEDIQVTIHAGRLVVKGETKSSRDGWESHRRVEKSVQLPESAIDTTGVEAINEHGMLLISVPKIRLQTPTPRSIPVKTAAALK